ncbi:MAG: epimerase, partial [Proteobacteria bacterium]|nr:epimerase [Pseudomonadota bacterium]
WISLTDTVRALSAVLDDDGMSGAVNVVAPSPVTNAEFSQTLGRVLHRPAILPLAHVR